MEIDISNNIIVIVVETNKVESFRGGSRGRVEAVATPPPPFGKFSNLSG